MPVRDSIESAPAYRASLKSVNVNPSMSQDPFVYVHDSQLPLHAGCTVQLQYQCILVYALVVRPESNGFGIARLNTSNG